MNTSTYLPQCWHGVFHQNIGAVRLTARWFAQGWAEMLCRVVSTIAQPAGVFVQILVSSASLVAVAEIGDKTPLATIALASEYQAIFWVTLGTTIGVLIANIPAVFFGAAYIANIPMNRVRILASIAFIGFGVFQVTQTF